MHLFYQPQLSRSAHCLEASEYQHCIRVLRHQKGDAIRVTDGQGLWVEARITSIQKDIVEFEVISQHQDPPPPVTVNLYIAPTKQMERMEWMVEKLCEIGTSSITFLQTARAERNKMRIDRLQKKALAALKQSRGSWLTVIHPLLPIREAYTRATSQRKLLAVVQPHAGHFGQFVQKGESIDLFIGPEGDFTAEEVKDAQAAGISPVSLGNKILRTETAGLLSCYWVIALNQF